MGIFRQDSVFDALKLLTVNVSGITCKFSLHSLRDDMRHVQSQQSYSPVRAKIKAEKRITATLGFEPSSPSRFYRLSSDLRVDLAPESQSPLRTRMTTEWFHLRPGIEGISRGIMMMKRGCVNPDTLYRLVRELVFVIW